MSGWDIQDRKEWQGMARLEWHHNEVIYSFHLAECTSTCLGVHLSFCILSFVETSHNIMNKQTSSPEESFNVALPHHLISLSLSIHHLLRPMNVDTVLFVPSRHAYHNPAITTLHPLHLSCSSISFNVWITNPADLSNFYIPLCTCQDKTAIKTLF